MTYDRNARQRERYATDPAYRERMLARGREWGRANHEKVYARKRRWVVANAEHLRAKRKEWFVTEMQKPSNRQAALRRASAGKLRKYGMTMKDYEYLLDRQGGGCMICREPPPEHKRLAVDHDHVTGLVRGLLCYACNHGLGSFRDSWLNLVAAAAYLSSRDASRDHGNLPLWRAKSVIGEPIAKPAPLEEEAA